jgi:hypothetical protein
LIISNKKTRDYLENNNNVKLTKNNDKYIKLPDIDNIKRQFEEYNKLNQK